MKQLKLILPLLALTFAVTLAFAFSKTNATAPMVQAFGDFSTGCELGDLQQENCSIENTGNECTVTKAGTTEEPFAYEDSVFGQCVDVLRQPQ